MGKQHLLDVGSGVQINYFDTGGQGPPVVILHGLAGGAKEFFPTARALTGFRTILLELRGHGRSTTRPVDLSRDVFVADVAHVIETAAAAPVALVGQSLGGHTAMLVAAKRPDLVSRLVLLESGAGGSSQVENMQLGEFFRSWPVPFSSRTAAREFLGAGPLAEAWADDLKETAAGYWPRFHPDVMAGTMDGLIQPRWQEWQAVSAPTLVIYGENGMFSEEEKAAFVSSRPGTLRVDLPAASHDGHLDAFEPWIAALRTFLGNPQSPDGEPNVKAADKGRQPGLH
ncbi:pimeloyl-ACP methyl ester carboxylesterase [Pseudarthrobacter sp. W1I19]|uniref:alpha/beta fold hydrolase n=1 Tax=Pseudarthrobacter sp. W1I19 TaxID=3042288 RepID=UPI00277E488F|nr:alpha/beta hydrolase [Pseudarthrobacter sp. W1I19]MDQ0921575.1 pimeloyl-ACP methyl ester carboxylesterase [Pseudarthrobacter sp. W1I19]